MTLKIQCELIKKHNNYLIINTYSPNNSLLSPPFSKIIMETSWFEQWFNTKYYHILYSHRDENEARIFLETLTNYINLPENSKIIDIGCGRGRHARFLNELNFSVTGIDIAQKNIDFAKKFENERLHFFCFDKRKIFEKGKFDLALNLFTSFGYLKDREDLEKALVSMAGNLKKGGLFVIDYLNAEKIKFAEFTSDKVVNEGIEFIINKEIKDHLIIKQIEVKDGVKNEQYREEVHLITCDEFRDLFETASLKILQIFGDYELGAFEPTESDRLIILAEKL